MSRGALVISLDFEMAWSYRRSPALDPGDLSLLRGTRDVVAKLLDIFNRYGISATWATVGHLMLRPEDCTNGRFVFDWPSPQYPWFHGNWYDGVPAFGEDGSEVFYAPDLVEKIVTSPTYQELGSHTFSHIDVGAKGCSQQTARAEFAMCQQLAKNWGRTLNSVVFPHNFAGHLSALEETGYQCYRGRNSEWYWLGLNWSKLAPPKAVRALIQPLRYLDEKWPLCPPLSPMKKVGHLWEIPHSMFFPGFHGVSKYISADDRSQRAKLGLKRAAEQGKIFSLWTHPENLLRGTDQLIPAFESVCREAAQLRDAGKLDILPMEQIAQRFASGESI